MSDADWRVVPLGRLRERPETLIEADAIFLTRANLVDEECINKWKTRLSKLAKNTPIWLCSHTPTNIINWNTGETLPLEKLNGLEISCVSALGNPEGFIGTLKSLGANIKEDTRYPDHYHYKEEDIKNLSASNTVIVTTLKDAVKWKKHWCKDTTIYVVNITLGFIDAEPNFLKWWNEKLESFIK